MTNQQMSEWYRTLCLLFFSTSIKIEDSDRRNEELNEIAVAIDNNKPQAEDLLRDCNKKLCDEINTALEDIDKRKKNAFNQAQKELLQKNPDQN